MKKFPKVLTSISAVSLLAACSSARSDSSADQQTEIEPTAVTGIYTRFVQGGDDRGAEGMPLSMVINQRNIIDAYLTDADGNKTAEASTTAAVELYISPSEGDAFTYNAVLTGNEWSPFRLDIDVDPTAGGNTAAVAIAPNPAGTETSADMFSLTPIQLPTDIQLLSF